MVKQQTVIPPGVTIRVIPPAKQPKRRLNLYGKGGSTLYQGKAPYNVPKFRKASVPLADRARAAMAKFSTEINEHGAPKSPVVEPEIAARFIPSTIPVTDVAQRKGKF